MKECKRCKARKAVHPTHGYCWNCYKQWRWYNEKTR